MYEHDILNNGNGDTMSHSGPRGIRAPTVDEALQYSPLTSILPFNSDIIPPPTAIALSTPLKEEHGLLMQDLDDLNKLASQTQSTSELLEHTLRHLGHLLKGDDLTLYSFPEHGRVEGRQHAPDQGNSPHIRPHTATLSPFARMLVKRLEVPYRYTITTSTPVKPHDQDTTASDRSPQQSVSSSNEHAVAYNYRRQPSSQDPGNGQRSQTTFPAHRVPTSPQTTLDASHRQALISHWPAGTMSAISVSLSPSISKQTSMVGLSTPSVIIPGLPPSVSPSDYKSFPDLDASERATTITPSKKRNPQGLGNDTDVAEVGIDQRQKAHAALTHLQDLLHKIFEAQDAAQVHASGMDVADGETYFTTTSSGDHQAPILVHAMHSKLESALQKAIARHQFGDVALEDLINIQKVCQVAVQVAQDTELVLESGRTEADLENWRQRIGVADNGLMASKVLLRIMIAGYNEKQLSSEEVLQNVINTLKHVLESSIIPAVETRKTPDTELFEVLVSCKQILGVVLQHATKVIELLGELIVTSEVSETTIPSIEFLTLRLIFAENGRNEKESILGIQKYEVIRRHAMDVIAHIFSQYPDQRTFVFDEILTSIEKLPTSKQSARQYKVADGKDIQLVSALIMRLIQSSVSGAAQSRRRPYFTNGDTAQSNTEEGFLRVNPQRNRSDEAEAYDQDPIGTLASLVKPLHDSAQSNAQDVVTFLVQRALRATKTGDQPYRNLLDIFTEDFLSVLGLPEWPASELLLRCMLSKLIGIIENDKSIAPAKNLALDLMGIMSSGISNLHLHLRQMQRFQNHSDSDLDSRLMDLGRDLLDEKVQDTELHALDGPYATVLEHLRQQHFDDDAQIKSARLFLLVFWAKDISSRVESPETGGSHMALDRVASKLLKAIQESWWLESDSPKAITLSQGRLAYTVITLAMPFSKAFKRIFSIMLGSMSSDQASVRSKSLKSVMQLLEKDPSILENGKYVLGHILRCARDPSPMVRDSALSLIGKCLALKPALENDCYRPIIAHTVDAAVGVRKRSIKLLRDMYLRNKTKEIRTAIADALLQRIKDEEESVQDLARQTLEEAWFSPFTEPSVLRRDSDPIHLKLALREQVSLIISTVQRGDSVLQVLEPFLRTISSADSKPSTANTMVSKSMVTALFEGIVDATEIPGEPTQLQILQTLVVFAKVNSSVFEPEQLELLQPYIQNLSSSDELAVYRCVVVILRNVIPSMSTLNNNFLKAIQEILLKSVPKLGKNELNEVSICLWAIDGVLKNTEKLVRLVMSVLSGIASNKNTDLNSQSQQAQQANGRLKRLLMIAGCFGRACDLDGYIATFRDSFSWYKGDSVSELMVLMLCPFANVGQPVHTREMALEAIGLICQASPKHYIKAEVNQVFESAFKGGSERLAHIVVAGFRSFFSAEETSEAGSPAEVACANPAKGSEKLGRSFVAHENDGISASIAQRFLQPITRLALRAPDAFALTATEVVASINRQGLVHPKECGPALVALETSPNVAIATIAFQEHKALHHKHETMFEKEYMSAVTQAFEYQKSVIGDALGYNGQPPSAKLRGLMEVLKTGSAKIRKKFLANLCRKIDFDPAKLQVLGTSDAHLDFSRFVLENLALFDYGRTDELLHVVSCLEKMFATIGTGVAHAIETEYLKSQQNGVDQMQNADPAVNADGDGVGSARLRQLTASSMILTMLWETRTYISRAWGLQKQRAATIKPSIKDLNKAPTRAQHVTSEKYLSTIASTMHALESPEAQYPECERFIELFSVDEETRVAPGDEMDDMALIELTAAGGYETPEEEHNRESTTPSVPGSGKGRKRKSAAAASNAGTPRKARRTSKPTLKKTGAKGIPTGDQDGEWGN